MILLVQYTLLFASVLLLVALGGCFAEHSGVINLGLEGIMVIGALGGALTMRYLPDGTPAFLIVVLVILVSMLAGLLYSCLLAVSAINCKADQTIVGTALNTFAIALCTIVNTSLISKKDSPEIGLSQYNLMQYLRFNTGNTFVDTAFSGVNSAVVLGVIAILVLWLMMNKTRFGLRLRACGENPGAADSVGSMAAL